MGYIIQLFMWMPNGCRILVSAVAIFFLVWVFTGFVRRVLDVIPFA